MPSTHRWNRGTTLATPGKPLVVGGSPNQRGVVAAASYEARKFGIHSAMPSITAIAKCPALIFVRPRFDVYRDISTSIHAIFKRYSDLVEGVALDEAYLDVTENRQNIPYASTIARHIKTAIFQETQLTATAGVSINKFLAKMASFSEQAEWVDSDFTRASDRLCRTASD
ncbi:hypothetical protein [Nostoc sphaeroides]|uniref:DNA-directed DNA polymerase n=1 Tax=Nostoc sphaeroides CCNUC1 TaxID=2653204 RepID=A0A5P8WDR3_9NOSO|nr:hypothetical protein [Nostoc sphaeroides]QFS50750.1 dinB, DNA polymerase IV [Nostoc sphaeroides CCNUC1]